MSVSEYEAMLGSANDSQPQAAGNEYEQLAQDMSSTKIQKVQASVAAASLMPDPDRQAKVLKLAQKTGLDSGLVSRNYDLLSKEVPNDNVKSYEKLVASNPGLSKFLEDPDNAALVKDDMGNIIHVEDKVKEFSGLDEMHAIISSGLAMADTQLAQIPAYAYGLAMTPANILRKMNGEEQIKTPDWLVNNPLAQRYGDAAKFYHGQVPDLNEDGVAALMSGDFAKAGRVVAKQAVEQFPQQMTTLVAMMTGFGTAGAVAGGVTQAAGSFAENANAGVDPLTNVLNSTAKGAFESLFEELGTVLPFEKMAASIAAKYGKETAAQVIKNGIKTVLYTAASEGSEEYFTSIAQDLTDYVMKTNPDATTGIFGRAANSGLVGFASGGLMTSPATISTGVVKGKALREATLAKDFYTSLGSSIEATKLRERSPERTQMLVNNIVEGGPVENIYITPDAFETYFQKKDLAPAAVANELGIQKEYEAAKASGADIQIKLADFAQKIVGTEHWKGLENDIKFKPESMSVNEAKAENEKIQAVDAQAVEQVEANKAQEVAVQTIEQNVTQQLMSTGMKQADARAQATLVGSTFKSLAEKSGMEVGKLFDKYGLKIQNAESVQATDGTALNQKVITQPGDMEGIFLRLAEKPEEKVTLKNGEEITLKPEPVRNGNKGAEWPGVVAYDSKGKKIGYVAVGGEQKADGFKTAASGVDVKKKYRRNGVATALYDYANKHIGTLVPASIQTDDGRKFSEAYAAKKTFNQGEEIIQGQIRFGKDRQFNIDLFKAKNKSTALHEMGHFFFEVMGDLAQDENASQSIKDDYATVLSWLGVESRDQIKTEHHEQFARGFESYLMEGKAPSAKLRKAFNTFKVWLTNIYKSAKGLNVELSDEVRGVMDRLVVAESETIAATTAMNYKGLLGDPRALGMSEEKSYEYINAVFEAKEHAESVIREKLMDDLRKKQSAEYKDKKAQVTEEITKEHNDTQLYKALAELQTGKQADGTDLPGNRVNATLDRASVESVYGKEFVKTLPKGIFSENGMHYEMVAPMLGYNDGDTMIQEFANSIPKNQSIENQVNAEMLKLYPEGLTSPTLPAEAIRAVHNDPHAKVLRMEAEFLQANHPGLVKEVIKRVARRMPTEKMVREQARQIIGAKNIGDLKGSKVFAEDGRQINVPGLIQTYQRAEIKFSKEAGVHLANGAYDLAFNAKRQELLNHELYRAAVEAKDTVSKTEKTWKKNFSKSDEDIAKSRDTDIVNAARAVLADFGITKAGKTAEEYLQNVKHYDPDVHSNVMNLVAMATANARDYKQINYDQFLTLSDTVDAMWNLAKSSREMTIEGKAISKELIIEALNARTVQLANGKEAIGYRQAVTDKEKRGIGLLGMVAAYRKVEHWAYAFDKGDINGAATKYLVRPIIEAQTRYLLKRVELHKKLEVISATLDKDTTTKIMAPELGYTFNNKQELLHAVLHSGNDSNLHKLLVGRAWGTVNEDKSLNRDRWDSMVERMQKDGTLTKADYDFAQAIWNVNEELKAGAQKAHKQMYGYYFNEVTANKITTAFGEYTGGYVPAVVDSYMNIDKKIMNDKEALEKFNNSFAFPTTGNGFTKTRVENYTAPLMLDLNKITQHMEKVLRFTELEPTIKDVTKLVTDKSFANNMAILDPTIVHEMLIPWMQRVATQRVITEGGFSPKASKWIRNNASVQFMALNVANWFQNTTGLFQVAIRVDASHIAGALKTYLSGPKEMSQDIQEKSDYMKGRIGETAADVSKQYTDVVLNPTKYEKIQAAAKDFAFIGERISNGMSEMVAWTGAYNQHMAQGNSETESTKFADATVRQTLSDTGVTGSSKVESGTAFERLFTMLSGFFFNSGNLAYSEMQIAKEMGLRSKAGGKRAAQAYIMLVMAPAIVSSVIMRAFAGKGLDANGDGEYLDDVLDVFGMSQIKFMTAMIPGGTLINSLLNQFNDKPYDDKINLSPAFGAIENAYSAISSIPKAITGNGSTSRALSDGLTAVGMVTGLPTRAIAKPLGYIADVNSGKARPTGPIDFTRGLVTGKDGNKK